MKLPYFPNHDDSSFFNFVSQYHPGLMPGGQGSMLSNQPDRAGVSLAVPQATTVLAVKYQQGVVIAGDRKVRYEEVLQVLDLLQKIVRERHNLPVILCTAFSCYKDDFSAWLADGYVVKSSNLKELKEEIRKVLEKRAQRQNLTSV